MPRGLPANMLALLCLVLPCLAARAASEPPTRLLRQPALSRDHLAFVYAGDIWVADRDGGHPLRLTAHPASEGQPHFSPDGKWIAFSAAYDNNVDVYVIPAQGGEPRRLTWHPGADVVTGWSPDSKRVLFVSDREVAAARSGQLYEVPLSGGYARKVMQAVAAEGAWSPDGKRLAYRPYIMAYSGSSGWRQHRGGNTPPLWIIDPAGNRLEKIPHVNASDSNPLWIGDNVAFISDRAGGSANLFLYDAGAKSVRQLTHESPWDVRHAAAYGHTIVYEVGGELKSLDVDSARITAIPIHLDLQSLQARPQWKDATHNITSTDLSASGKRVLVTARGEVFSVPVKDGAVRNLTGTSGVRESDALWSHDGQKVAYLSDAGGTQALLVRDADGLSPPVHHSLGTGGFFSLLAWSPEGRRILFQDNHLHLYAIELAHDAVTLLDTSSRRHSFATSFSPDGQWVAYTVANPNYLTQVRLHSFATARSTPLADGFVQTDHPVFGSSELLYFTASIDAGPSRSSLDMSTQERPLRSALYCAVLSASGHSPLPPKSGDEEPPAPKEKDKPFLKEDDADKEKKTKEGAKSKDSAAPAKGDEKGGEKGEAPSATHVDLAGLELRLVPIPVAERNYDDLLVAHDGSLFYLARPQPGSAEVPPGGNREADGELFRYSFEDRAEKSLRSSLVGISASADRKKLLLTTGPGRLEVADAGEKLEAKPVDLSGMRALIDPRAEWHQIFDEAWRMEQDYFYDPGMHGLDWRVIRERYEPLLAFVQRREDLNELLVEMIGELQVGHNRISGGDVYTERSTDTGLLGADFRIHDGLYQIAKIYRGDAWNPFLVSPLTASGVNAAEGDTILAINGHALDATQDISALLEGTARKQVALTLSRDGTPKTARTVTVIPTNSEGSLRLWNWVQSNQEYVARKTGGKVAYVYLPDTAADGYTFFNRMFFAQVDKQALIIDDRRNSGGQAANYVMDVLSRKHLSGWKDRDGLAFNTPAGAIYGPKVMLINQDAGSGGDYMPWSFRSLGLGKLMGTRTWGGIIGIFTNPRLIDGGTLSVPFFRMYSPDGHWRIENEGVAPDVEVDLDPLAVNSGVDTQLDAAIAEVLGELAAAKPERMTAPPYPTSLGK
jgi:tricorn protease